MQYFDRLAAVGHQASHLDLSGGIGNYLRALAVARKADVVLVLRKTLPTPLLWLLRKLARRLVFDFDDAIFCNTDGTRSPTRMSRFAAMVQCCDQISAGNGFLAAAAMRFNPRVSVVPTSVDIDRYFIQNDKPQDFFDVVWIGSSSTRKYLEEAIPALQAASRRISNLRLKIVADFDLPSCGLNTWPVRWQAETEAAELASAHVGIAPMRDDDWSRGKCALKVLQYMAAGLPVISSPAGVNAEAVLDRESGFLVREEREWVEALVELAGSTETRERMGQAGRKRVVALYSVSIVFSRLLAVIDSVLPGKD